MLKFFSKKPKDDTKVVNPIYRKFIVNIPREQEITKDEDKTITFKSQ